MAHMQLAYELFISVHCAIPFDSDVDLYRWIFFFSPKGVWCMNEDTPIFFPTLT